MEKERQKPKLDLKQIQKISKMPQITHASSLREEFNLWWSPVRTKLDKHIRSNPLLFAAESFSAGIFTALFLTLCFSGHTTPREPAIQTYAALPQIAQSYLQEPAQLSSNFQEPVLQAQNIYQKEQTPYLEPDVLDNTTEQTAAVTASNTLMKSLQFTPRNMEKVLKGQQENFTPQGYEQFLSELNRTNFLEDLVRHDGVLSAIVEQPKANEGIIISDGTHYQFMLKATILFEDAKLLKEENILVQVNREPGALHEFKIDQVHILENN